MNSDSDKIIIHVSSEYFLQSPEHDGAKSPDSLNLSGGFSSSSSCGSPYSSEHSSLTSSVESRFSQPYLNGRRSCRREWPKFDTIHEEMYSEDELSKGAQCLFGMLAFCGIFAIFCSITWCASRPFRAHIDVKSLTLHNIFFGQGSDYTGIPTKMLTLNCSLNMDLYNPATFFGLHITSTPLNLMYSEITIASGQLVKYYQPRKSHGSVVVKVEGYNVPLYGAGLGYAMSEKSGQIPVKLQFDIRSLGHVVGILVRSKHQIHVTCCFIINPHGPKTVKFNDSSCTYI